MEDNTVFGTVTLWEKQSWDQALVSISVLSVPRFAPLHKFNHIRLDFKITTEMLWGKGMIDKPMRYSTCFLPSGGKFASLKLKDNNSFQLPHYTLFVSMFMPHLSIMNQTQDLSD